MHHPPNTGWVPALSGPCTIARIVQIGSNVLWTIALIHILVKDNPHYGSFLLVDVQFVQFMLALVDTPTPYKVIAIRRISALEVTFFYKLAQTGAGTDGSLFAFSVRLPESDVVQQFVSVVVETLLTLLGTPYRASIRAL